MDEALTAVTEVLCEKCLGRAVLCILGSWVKLCRNLPCWMPRELLQATCLQCELSSYLMCRATNGRGKGLMLMLSDQHA